MNKSRKPTGVHLVGSVPFDDSHQVFTRVASSLGAHIKRIPDGETGERSNWVDWQLPKLEKNPNLELIKNGAYEYTEAKMVGLCEGCNSSDIHLDDLGYADAAIHSFAQFSDLKGHGKIPAHCRFQVSLPTPIATSHLYVHPSLQGDFEPEYERRLLVELNEIIDAIPNDQLAIQWDTAVEFALLEGVMPTYIQDLETGIIERLSRLCAAVPNDVEMGFHLCYGDSQHKHFCEPMDMGKLVRVANSIASTSSRPVNWVHMPVPRDRTDNAYFKPLENLRLRSETELFLGLIHQTDGAEGSRNRIDAARKFVQNFGVATECGFGRRPKSSLDELMLIHTSVCDPVN